MRHPATLALHAVALTAVLGGSATYLNLDRTVTISVDGHRREVRTFSRTVSGVLRHAGVTVGSHDLVSPGLALGVHNGDNIVVQRSREVTLTVDGQPENFWTTAPTVGAALAAANVAANAFVSVPATAAVSSGMQIDARLPKTITIVDGGARRQFQTTAATVADALAEAGVTLGPRDVLRVDPAAAVTDGLAVPVTRVLTTTIARGKTIAAPTVTVADPRLPQGTSRSRSAGRPGIRSVTYSVTYVDGKSQGWVLTRNVVSRQPVARVILRGTKPAPVAVPRVSAGGGLNWAGLAACESGGNPHAVNPAGYYGLYQFDLGTWHAIGGSGNPANASAAEQTARAQMLYAQRGRSPWPVCGARL